MTPMTTPLIPATVTGSLPKPGWLAQTQQLWPQWRAHDDLDQAKADATLLWVKLQEDIGINIVGDGEQARQHFVHGFLDGVEGIDTVNKVTMAIRNGRYEALVPQVVAPISLRGRIHGAEAQVLRAHTSRPTKFTLPGPLTLVDTVADAHYGDRAALVMAFAELLNHEALALQGDGIDIVQFDEPAFNVYPELASTLGIQALERAAQGLTCTTAVHICYGYGIEANARWKQSLGHEWRQYEEFFPALADSSIQQVSVECIASQVPMELIALLTGKAVMVGAIDVASDRVETPEEVAEVLLMAADLVGAEQVIASTNCGMAPMRRSVAEDKLRALVAGAAQARRALAG